MHRVGFQRRELSRWAPELVISYELLIMINRGAQAPGDSGGYCRKATCRIGGGHCSLPFRDLVPT
jgi:hypothetical protein